MLSVKQNIYFDLKGARQASISAFHVAQARAIYPLRKCC